MDYREACLVASGEVDVNSNESDSESETDIAGYTSIRDKAKFLSKILRIDDNLHTVDADELRRHPAKFIEEMNSKKKKDAEKVPLITSESASSNEDRVVVVVVRKRKKSRRQHVRINGCPKRKMHM